MDKRRYLGIEAGGTKVLCAIADGKGTILADCRIDTTSPDKTFDQIAAFLARENASPETIAASGIASFGPLDLAKDSSTYGYLTTTPKLGWQGADVLGRLLSILPVPCAIDTDVNCAARGEGQRGAAIGLERFCYITVGTGIGVGIIGLADAAGTGHAEAGHVRLGRAAGDDFAGICPSHGDCIEGLACGPAMRARWGVAAEDLPQGHVGWAYEAHYIAALCISLTYIVRPQRIVIGGGVLERAGLLADIRTKFAALSNGYATDRWSRDPETYLAAPMLVSTSPGLVGALALAADLVR